MVLTVVSLLWLVWEAGSCSPVCSCWWRIPRAGWTEITVTGRHVVLMLGLGFTLCRSHPCSSLASFGPSLGGLPESCSGLLSLLLKGHLYRKPFVSTRDTLFTNSLFCLRYLMETTSFTILLSMGFHTNFSFNTESLSYTITSSFRRLWSTSLPEFLQPAFPQYRHGGSWRFFAFGTDEVFEGRGLS